MIYAALAIVLFVAPLLAVLGHDLIVNRQMVRRRESAPPKVYVVLGGYEWEEDDLIGVFSNPDKARAAKRQAEHAYGERRSHRTAWIRTATPDQATMPWESRD